MSSPKDKKIKRAVQSFSKNFMKNNSEKKLGPNRLNTHKIFQDSNPSIFCESGSARQPKVLVKTFGWPMDAVLYDYRKVFKRDLVNCLKGYSYE